MIEDYLWHSFILQDSCCEACLEGECKESYQRESQSEGSKRKSRKQNGRDYGKCIKPENTKKVIGGVGRRVQGAIINLFEKVAPSAPVKTSSGRGTFCGRYFC